MSKVTSLNSLKVLKPQRAISFTKAADELFVTQAAVSHQIKTRRASGLVISRRNRALLLTEEGELILPISKKHLIN